MLPGGGYEKKDLGAISEAADVACKDGKLMELAWEVNIPMPAALEGISDYQDIVRMSALRFQTPGCVRDETERVTHKPM